MAITIESYIILLETRLEQFRAERAKYPAYGTKQDEVLLHFIERAEQFVGASITAKDYPLSLSVISRILCEDFFLVVWIAESEKNALEYEAGVLSEVAKMMEVNLAAGRSVIQNKTTKTPVSAKFMDEELLPKLRSLKAPRARIEALAKGAGLQRVYDILYRGTSLEVHGNTFGFWPSIDGHNFTADIPLSSIAAVAKCLIAVIAFPRRSVPTRELLTILGLEKLKGK
jgi:hypothetical protein